MSEIIEALLRLNAAFAAKGLKPPVLVSVDSKTLRKLESLAATDGKMPWRYAAQGFPVCEIVGVKFSDKLPAGIHHPQD